MDTSNSSFKVNGIVFVREIAQIHHDPIKEKDLIFNIAAEYDQRDEKSTTSSIRAQKVQENFSNEDQVIKVNLTMTMKKTCKLSKETEKNLNIAQKVQENLDPSNEKYSLSLETIPQAEEVDAYEKNCKHSTETDENNCKSAQKVQENFFLKELGHVHHDCSNKRGCISPDFTLIISQELQESLTGEEIAQFHHGLLNEKDYNLVGDYHEDEAENVTLQEFQENLLKEDEAQILHDLAIVEQNLPVNQEELMVGLSSDSHPNIQKEEHHKVPKSRVKDLIFFFEN